MIETQAAKDLEKLAVELTQASQKDPDSTRIPVLLDIAMMLTETCMKASAAPVDDPETRGGFWQVTHDIVRAVRLAMEVHSVEWAYALHGLALLSLTQPDVFLMFVDKLKEATLAATREVCTCDKCTALKAKGGDKLH